MPLYQYIALDSQGVEVKDRIEALSEKEAISKIRNMLSLIHISEPTRPY